MAEQLKKIPITGYPYDETSKLVDYNMHTGVRTIKTEGYPAQQITSSQDRYNLKYAPSSLKEQSNQFINDQRSWDGIRKIKDAKSMSFDKWQSKWGGSENEWVSSKNQKLTAEDMDKISKEGGETYREKFVSPADRGDTTSSDAAQSKATSAAEGSQKRQQQATEDYKKSGYTGSFSEWDMAGSPDATQVAKDKAGADAYADAQKGTVTLNDKSTPAKQAGTTNEKSNNTNTMPKTLIDTLSSGARKLVDLALQTDNTTDLSSKSFWNTAPDADRKGAWAALQKITGSAKEMSDYVSGSGLQNVQNLSWWSKSPHKQEAWNLVKKGQSTGPTGKLTGPIPQRPIGDTSDIAKGTNSTKKGVGKSPGGTTDISNMGGSRGNMADKEYGNITYLGAKKKGFIGTFKEWDKAGRPADGKGTGADPVKPDTTTATDATKTDPTTGTSPINSDAVKAAMKIIQDDKTLSEDEKSLFSRIVTDIDVSRGISLENILKEFQKQKTGTIDPEFKAQTDFFIDQLQSSVKFQEQDRIREIEAERALSGENIRQAKAGMEKAGMTFTGKGIEELGAESAYSQTDQIPFGGAYFEGKTQQANRLMSSGSLARYQKNLNTLGTQAEGTLGSGNATLQNIPGYQASGNITGSLEENRQKMLAATASSIYDKEAARAKAAEPISQKVANNLNLNNL